MCNTNYLYNCAYRIKYAFVTHWTNSANIFMHRSRIMHKCTSLFWIMSLSDALSLSLFPGAFQHFPYFQFQPAYAKRECVVPAAHNTKRRESTQADRWMHFHWKRAKFVEPPLLQMNIFTHIPLYTYEYNIYCALSFSLPCICRGALMAGVPAVLKKPTIYARRVRDGMEPARAPLQTPMWLMVYAGPVGRTPAVRCTERPIG